MSVRSLDDALQLLRRVLALEQQQGYRNRAATGGLYRYFQDQFDGLQYDADAWSFVEGVLAALRRYESAKTVDERRIQVEILSRRIEARRAGPRPQSGEAPGPVSAAHAGTYPSLRKVRTRERGSGPDSATRNAYPAGVPLEPVDSAPNAPIAAHGPATPGSNLPSRAKPLKVPVALDQPIAEALGIRSREAQLLARIGVATVEDALYYLPRTHYDCRKPVPLNKLRPGMTTTIVGTLQQVNTRRSSRGHVIVEARIADATAVVRVSWFSQYMGAVLRPRVGQSIAVSGHITLLNGRLNFVPRDYEFPDEDELTHTGRLVPLYALTEGLSQRWLRGTIKRALDASIDLIEDPLPAWLHGEFSLPHLNAALQDYHFPTGDDEKARALRRLAFDELLYINIGMMRRKRAWQLGETCPAIPRHPSAEALFVQRLSFALTGAQERVIGEILDDMARAVPMRRLLQGDVGAGKTVVAALALYMAARAGLQGAIMAPTAILAEQHFRSIAGLLERFDVSIALLTGSVTGAERRRVLEGVAGGEISVVAGTHALIQQGVDFDRLGLAVIDEQHRFGVEQRAMLRQKGYNPHVLAMTATPIPRTLQLTIFGDLDVSVIDERPPGRQPIETRWEISEAAAFGLVREQVKLGHQAFVICPLVDVDGSEDYSADDPATDGRREARAAVAERKRLQTEVFPELTVDLLHGQLKPADKDAVLGRFRDGEIDVLVATSVVEVGIDVPNATVMVIEAAHRFGLAQLHQLRGRVGRGAHRSYCILLSDAASTAGQQRLEAITSTEDGFLLAARDLDLRGPGEFLGTRQSGLPTLKIAALGDTRTIEEARRAAEALLQRDPELAAGENAALKVRVERFWSRESERS